MHDKGKTRNVGRVRIDAPDEAWGDADRPIRQRITGT
jgi:hypothetical protein